MSKFISRCAAIAVLVASTGTVTAGAYAGGLDGLDLMTKIIDDVKDAAHDAAQKRSDRCIAGFVKEMNNKWGNQLNLLVFDLSEPPQRPSGRIRDFQSTRCGDAVVGVWAFE